MTTRKKRAALGKLVTIADRLRVMAHDPELMPAIIDLKAAMAATWRAMQTIERTS